eukprot:TRINITY_DN14248_c0_g1_i1.p1 TRINITY_DN14248_c0_g1~~TRINITY_DN14248_c0_g1_i1.p1  ORF type:complete len:525 (+),score=118.64 TRINITY_DN14248_c0_g1_i1:24-1598(+)
MHSSFSAAAWPDLEEERHNSQYSAVPQQGQSLGSPAGATGPPQPASVFSLGVSRYGGAAGFLLGLIAVLSWSRGLHSTTGHAPLLRQSPAAAEVTSLMAQEQLSGIDKYFLLGEGDCLNQTGAPAALTASQEVPDADVLMDGRSLGCEEVCSKNKDCTGYWTQGRRCFALIDKDFLPASVGGGGASAANTTTRCFWRHKFVRNSTDAYPAGQAVEIPKILWSFWEVRPTSEPIIQDFVKLCTSTWSLNNPNWEVRILNTTTVKKWLGPSDLPEGFDNLSVQLAHKADIIRLALLAKYGGVWLDATSILLQPLDDLFGSSRQRTFFNLPFPALLPGLQEKRVDWTYHVENWVLAAPAKDLLLRTVGDCVWKFFQEPHEKTHHFETTGLFTKAQIEMLRYVGVWEYLSTTACFLKAIDEDAAIADWYNSPRVRHINPVAKAGTWWWTQPDLAKKVLLESVNQTMVGTLLHGVPIFKFDHKMREGWIRPLTPEELLCRNNTLQVVLHSLGVPRSARCNESLEESVSE